MMRENEFEPLSWTEAKGTAYEKCIYVTFSDQRDGAFSEGKPFFSARLRRSAEAERFEASYQYLVCEQVYATGSVSEYECSSLKSSMAGIIRSINHIDMLPEIRRTIRVGDSVAVFLADPVSDHASNVGEAFAHEFSALLDRYGLKAKSLLNVGTR